MRARIEYPPVFASGETVEVVAPVSPATEALRAFHRPHPEMEVGCDWCREPLADCPDPQLHDRLHREAVEDPDAWPVNACPADGRALGDHRGPAVRFRGQTFGERACAERYATDWPHRAQCAAPPRSGPLTVPVLLTTDGGLYLPGDVVERDVQSATGGRCYTAGSRFNPEGAR